MGRWWFFGPGPVREHNSMVDDAGAWPAAMVSLRTLKFYPSAPQAQPPRWWRSNAPVPGAWVPIPLGFVQQGNEKTKAMRKLPNIGPTDTSSAQAAALQGALAASLRKAAGGN